MDFIEEILKYRSLAVVGLEKNTGKTECLNYILRQLNGRSRQIALTSIGVDGESRDQVCQTPKPEINVFEGMIFVTSEKHYREKRLLAEILSVSDRRTALGRLVTARAKSSGKVILSGPSDTVGLKCMIQEMERWQVGTTIVDGALSRLSIASPVVTEAMILATGAALSANIPQLVRKTKYVYDLIRLELAEEKTKEKLLDIDKGIWAIDDKGEIHDLDIPSVFMLENRMEDIFRHGYRLFVAGAVSDRLFRVLQIQKQSTELVIRDFTRIFATPECYYAFLRKGGKVQVLQKNKLLAVTINPQSPGGYCLDSDKLRVAMEKELEVGVYDVLKMGGR